MRRLPSVLAAAAIITAAGAASAGSPEPGRAAPGLVGPELSGEVFDLGKLRGKVVVVDFWATWCPPCRADMPLLDTLYRRHRPDGLELIGVSTDRPHERAKVRAIMADLSYPAAMAEDARVDGFGEMRTLPRIFVIDRDGVVRAVLGGDEQVLTNERLEAAVSPLLSRSSDAATGR
jgi:thiol-disulfide isomerase/thioredoxin